MKLSTWAKQQGVTYRAAYNWFRTGRLPVPVRQLPSGTILVDDTPPLPVKSVAIYARVSGHDQKHQLDGQVARCLVFANQRGLAVSKTITEIGSGLNGHRKKLMTLLADQEVGMVIVEHRDRLMRFGAEYLEVTLSARGIKLLVVDESELTDDLVEDMIAVLTSFCARLYGRRSAKNRAVKALAACQEENL